jgi:hypothetical protein
VSDLSIKQLASDVDRHLPPAAMMEQVLNVAATQSNNAMLQLMLLGVVSTTTTFYFSRRFCFRPSAFSSWIERFDAQEVVKCCLITLSLCAIIHLEPQHAWTLDLAVQLIAISMLLRNPAWLKRALEPVRIVLGPVFPILTAGIAKYNPNDYTQAAAVCALLAVTVFRPDNSATAVAVIGTSLTMKTRRIIHGMLLFSAFLLDFFVAWQSQSKSLAIASGALAVTTAVLATCYYSNRYLIV